MLEFTGVIVIDCSVITVIVVEPEIGAQHAGDRECPPVQGDTLADDLWVGAEVPLPGRMAEDRNLRLTGLILFGKQKAAEQRPGPEHGKQV